MINASDAQLIAICRGAAQRCEEQHAYMALARRDPHSWLPHKWVVDAMRDSLSINSERTNDLLSALLAITNSGPDAIPINEAFEMAYRAIERAMRDK